MLRCVGDLTGRRRGPACVRNAKRKERTGKPIADDRHSRDSAPRRHGSGETLHFTPKLGASGGRLALKGDGYDAGDRTSGGDFHRSASSQPAKRTGNIARLIDAVQRDGHSWTMSIGAVPAAVSTRAIGREDLEDR